MNKASANLDAARLRRRIESMMEQELNKRFDIIDLRRERNERGAVQVRSIAGNIEGAVFGSPNGGSNIVGP